MICKHDLNLFVLDDRMSYHQIGFLWLDLIDPYIIFSMKVYLILDEFILAGELQETSKKVLFSYATTYLFSTMYVLFFHLSNWELWDALILLTLSHTEPPLHVSFQPILSTNPLPFSFFFSFFLVCVLGKGKLVNLYFFGFVM